MVRRTGRYTRAASTREADVSLRSRSPRRRRMRVRVQTDGEAYVGTLSLGGSLADILDDGRAYLALRDAVLEGTGSVEEFVAIHKGSIRSVAVVPEPKLALVGSES